MVFEHSKFNHLKRKLLLQSVGYQMDAFIDSVSEWLAVIAVSNPKGKAYIMHLNCVSKGVVVEQIN